ncbi:MAG: MoaD/ThiS family protein, partial [Chloroflexota bacterium]|nr:MoaD/ThiS family protein [Chloroflexota bacterium]
MEVLVYRSSGVGARAMKERLEVEMLDFPTTIGDVLRRLAEDTGRHSWLGDEAAAGQPGRGRLRPGVTVAVNRRDIGTLDGLDTVVAANDEVAIVGDAPPPGEHTPGAKHRLALRFYGPAAARWGLEAGVEHELLTEGDVTLRAVLARFSAGFGAELSDWLLDPRTGHLRPFIKVAHNGAFLNDAS